MLHACILLNAASTNGSSSGHAYQFSNYDNEGGQANDNHVPRVNLQLSEVKTYGIVFRHTEKLRARRTGRGLSEFTELVACKSE